MNRWVSALKYWGSAVKIRAYNAWQKIVPLLKQIDWSDPRTWGIIAVIAILLITLIWLIARAMRRRPKDAEVDESARAPLRPKIRAKQFERTLADLRQDEPQFVELIDSILKDRSVDQLLSYDEISAAFGRLSEIQDKSRQQTPKKRSSLLALEQNPTSRERNAAMLTVVRSCYGNEAIYSKLDEKGRRLVDQFLDSVAT